MSSHLMSHDHQTSIPAVAQPQPWDWRLPAGRAEVLPVADTPRWLTVNEGRVWLTALSSREQAEDIWLAAGEGHALPPGTAWVLEGWPQASVNVLLAAPRAAPQ
jgi:hypothetical protein